MSPDGQDLNVFLPMDTFLNKLRQLLIFFHPLGPTK